MKIEIDIDQFIQDHYKLFLENKNDIRLKDRDAYIKGCMIGFYAISEQMTKRQHDYLNEHIDEIIDEII